MKINLEPELSAENTGMRERMSEMVVESRNGNHRAGVQRFVRGIVLLC